jgi:hypothetical protein
MGHVWLGFEPAQIVEWLAQAGFEPPRIQPLAAQTAAKGPALFAAAARRGGKPPAISSQPSATAADFIVPNTHPTRRNP